MDLPSKHSSTSNRHRRQSGKRTPRAEQRNVLPILPDATPGPTASPPFEYVESSNKAIIWPPGYVEQRLRSRKGCVQSISEKDKTHGVTLSVTTAKAEPKQLAATVPPRPPYEQKQRQQRDNRKSLRLNLRFPKPPNKQDISSPLPSPAHTTFEQEFSYTPHRAVPTTPPLPLYTPPSSGHDEVSYIDWDEKETFTFSKVRQTLMLGHHNKQVNKPHATPKPGKAHKSPDRHVNATPRAMTSQPNGQKAATRSRKYHQQPSASINIGRPRKQSTITTIQSNPDIVTPTSTPEVFYRGPDLTGTSIPQPQNSQASPRAPMPRGYTTNRYPARQSSKNSFPIRPTTSHAHAHPHPHPHPHQQHPPTPPLRPNELLRTHTHPTELPSASTDPGPFLAHEARTILMSPYPTPPESTVEKPTRLKQIVQGLLRHASRGNLRKERAGHARGSSW